MSQRRSILVAMIGTVAVVAYAAVVGVIVLAALAFAHRGGTAGRTA